MHNTKVDQYDRIVLEDEDVTWLEIAMNDAPVVSGLEPFTGLTNDVDQSFRGKVRSRGFQQFP